MCSLRFTLGRHVDSGLGPSAEVERAEGIDSGSLWNFCIRPVVVT